VSQSTYNWQRPWISHDFYGEFSFSGKSTSFVAPEGFVLVEAGTFQMGSTDGDDDEKPVHRVTISRSFYMSQYEVTQKQWREVMGTNPSLFKGDNLPVEQVSWDEAVEYCNRLSRKEGLTPCYSGSGDNTACDFSANGYRLPTEAEWEYAARGGNKSRSYIFSGSNSAGEVGWYYDNSGDKTHPVGQKMPNELGLYDMSGNVWELCWDWYDGYSSSSQTDPRGPSNGSCRLYRGGSWVNFAQFLRAFIRIDFTPSGKYLHLGFRPVRMSE
jgi:sulfatase modifying factor 1